MFQYDTPVGPDSTFYDAGVALSSDGFFGRHDYIKHATRGSLNIQSLYLVLWSTFCGFSIALLTQEEAEHKLAGRILSDEEPVRQYCSTQIRKLWNLLKEGLNISEEERLLLVCGCLNNLLEVHLEIHISTDTYIILFLLRCSKTCYHHHLFVGNFVHRLTWIAMKGLGITKSLSLGGLP